MSNKKAKSDQVDKHHIYPSSRVPSRKKDRTNLKKVPRGYHRAYHYLFANMRPDEIIDYLQKVWFNPNEFISPENWRDTHQSLAEL